MSDPIASHKIMMAGVVPPPVHGQSIATKALFDADLRPIVKVRIEIRSSKVLRDVGKLTLNKCLSIITLIGQTWLKWLKHRPQVLYYTAGSGAWVPFARDFLFLTLCRPLFRRVLIHYHSGNLVDFLNQSRIRRMLGRYIYGRGAWTIRLGRYCPAPTYPQNKIFDVPNGIDLPADLAEKKPSDSFRILFLGNLFEDKGVLDLIEAVHALALKKTKPITLSLVGGWTDEPTRCKIENRISNLPNHVHCPPPAPSYGAEKWDILRSHDVLAFPTYYSSENLPLVIIEAMAAGLPVISTDWRGIKTLIEDQVTGILIKPRDVSGLTEALEITSNNSTYRANLEKRAHLFYLKNLTLEAHIERMKMILLNACSDLAE